MSDQELDRLFGRCSEHAFYRQSQPDEDEVRQEAERLYNIRVVLGESGDSVTDWYQAVDNIRARQNQSCCVMCDKTVCAICYESLYTKTWLRTKCQHSFHAQCLRHWFQRGSNTCPLCRAFTIM